MLQDAQKRRAAGDILTITEIERASCLFTFQFFSTFSFNSCTSTKNREEISDEMKVDHDEGEDDHNDNEEEEKDDKEEEEIKEERDDKGLGKDIHNKAFQYPQKPKEHTKATEKLPGSFCEEEILPLLPPLGEQREEGGEGKRGAAKYRFLGWNNDIRNCMKRGNMMNEHHPSPSSASNSLNVRSHPHFELPSSNASVTMQQEECKQIPLSSSSSSSSSYSSSHIICQSEFE